MTPREVLVLETQREQAMNLLNHGYCRGLHLFELQAIFNVYIDRSYHHQDIYERQQHVIRECYRLLDAHYAEQAKLFKKEKTPKK